MRILLKDEEARIVQAIDFYLKTCEKSRVIPQQPDFLTCKIGRKYIRLNYKNGEIAKLRYDKTHLYLELEGESFKEKLKLNDMNFAIAATRKIISKIRKLIKQKEAENRELKQKEETK